MEKVYNVLVVLTIASIAFSVGILIIYGHAMLFKQILTMLGG